MYLERETADELLQEEHGRIRRLLLKCRNKAKARAFVNRCILVHLFALLFCLSDNAGSGNDFNINLNLFTGEGCLLIWFWLIYRFLGLAGFQPEAFHAAVKTSDRACIFIYLCNISIVILQARRWDEEYAACYLITFKA